MLYASLGTFTSHYLEFNTESLSYFPTILGLAQVLIKYRYEVKLVNYTICTAKLHV